MQKSFIRRVLGQASNKISHAGKQLADRAIFADAITHFHECALDRPGHSVEQLKLKAAAIDPQLVRERLCVCDTANVVRSEGSGNDGFIFEKHARERLEIRVALGLLKINRTIPAILPRFRRFVIPVCAFHQPDCEPGAAGAAHSIRSRRSASESRKYAWMTIPA